ncbi:MAG: putative toxin-antitoxin system toxin component, PIN family [bacterium]|nr:putative toxin-antitoxin system toxin component, PIN family [bacterium]
MRVVADTNIIISMLLWGKSLERFLVLVNTRRITLCFSPQTIDELFRVIYHSHIQKQAEKLKTPVETLLDKLIAASEIVYPTQRVAVIREDPSDNRILETAIAARVRYIVTGDRHLLKCKQHLNIPIVTPAEFLKLLRNK